MNNVEPINSFEKIGAYGQHTSKAAALLRLEARLREVRMNAALAANQSDGSAPQPQPVATDQLAGANTANGPSGSFQDRVLPWMLACFGPVIPFDKTERNHRFLEEALELVQSIGCTQSEAHQLVDYVFGRTVGEPMQEVGGVMVTLAALCIANNLDMAAAGETELARIWTKVEKIRAKQAAKPKHSPLPGPSDPQPSPHQGEVSVDEVEKIIREHVWPSEDGKLVGVANAARALLSAHRVEKR